MYYYTASIATIESGFFILGISALPDRRHVSWPQQGPYPSIERHNQLVSPTLNMDEDVFVIGPIPLSVCRKTRINKVNFAW